MINKRFILILVLVLIVASLLFGLSFFNKRDTKPISRTSSTDRIIKKLEDGLRVSPKNTKLYIQLSSAYLQKVRETADVSLYKKVDDLVHKAEELDPNNPEIFATRASVALGRHDFTNALSLGQKALALNPKKASYYGIVGDAQIELGMYKQAIESFQKMMDIRPDLSSFNRIAYVRELYGDIDGAKEALELAISSGSSYPENVAWSYVELGKLYMRSDLGKAKNHFEHALKILDNYPPALEGLGKIAFAKKNYKESLTNFEKAFATLPIASYAIDMGDVYKVKGNKEKAKTYYLLANLAFDKSRSSGVNTDLEEAQFLTNHDLDLQKALDKAQAAYRLRKSIYCADALAWALYKNNEIDQAQRYIKEALRLGEHESLIIFHAGMIAQKNENPKEAQRLLKKALSLNPYFSMLQVKVANDTLNALKN